MMTGEVDLRRRRLGPVRDAAVRPAGGVHRRADGRAHAGVPRQEDRGARDQARRRSARSRCRCSCWSRPRSRSRRSTARRRSTTPARRASPRRSTPTSRRRNNNGSAFAGYTGFVQPNAPGNVGAFGITFADLLGGVAMLFGRFVPLRARARRRRLARRQAGRARRARARCAPTRRTFVVLLIGDRPARRAADLRPRPAARPDRPGPLDPALLTMRKDLISSARRRRRLHGALRPRLPARRHRRRARSPSRTRPTAAASSATARSSARRLIGQDFTPGRPPRYFQSRPSVTDYNPAGDVLQQPRPEQRGAARTSSARTSTPTWRSSGPSTPGCAPPTSRPTRSRPSASGVDPHISPANAAIQARRVARERGAPLRAGPRADRRQHRRPLARRPRRARRQRARAQPRPRRGAPRDDRPSPALAARAGDPAPGAASPRCASSTRASRSATRSCSSSRSAPRSRRSAG